MLTTCDPFKATSGETVWLAEIQYCQKKSGKRGDQGKLVWCDTDVKSAACCEVKIDFQYLSTPYVCACLCPISTTIYVHAPAHTDVDSV